MHRLAIINVVGLTKNHIGEHTPNITALANKSSVHLLDPPLPAVTSTVQSTLLTGKLPQDHGIVANGWHERETNSTHFWRQSNELVQGEMIWDAAKLIDPNFTCANMFWWFNMYSSADISVTPRPIYRADGQKIPDIWTNPIQLRDVLQKELGQFPLFNFWGPKANITSSRWIIDASIIVDQKYSPSLMFVYVPHLDYALQKVGPSHKSIANELALVDNEVGKLIDHFTKQNVGVCLLSEYGIDEVHAAVAINKKLREAGFLAIRNELGREYLDAGQSIAFAVPDHQIAHVYVRENIENVVALLEGVDGISHVLQGEERNGLAHDRCGELVVVAEQGFWFTHDWWHDESCVPDYQQTVDIHRKPGFDPRELFFAKGWRGSKPRIALKLLLKKLGMRTSFDVISMDESLVSGSHGRTPSMGATSPIIIPPTCATKPPDNIPAESFKDLVLTWQNLT